MPAGRPLRRCVPFSGAAPRSPLRNATRNVAPLLNTKPEDFFVGDRKKPPKRRGGGGARRPDDGLTVRRVPGEDAWELALPRCALARRDDMEQVRAMLAAGEVDVAVDELRWLLNGCDALVEAHQLLGEIALAEGDLELARGHLGYGYELVAKALRAAAPGCRLPFSRPANQSFFKLAAALARCLHRLGDRQTAGEIVNRLLALDPSDPLDVKSMLRPPPGSSEKSGLPGER